MVQVPENLAANCRNVPERIHWLDRLPDTLEALKARWSLTLDVPFDTDCAWVAPVTLPNGRQAVLKLGMPHFEGLHELQGMVFWNGDPTAAVLQTDEEVNALLLERCIPGTPLKTLPEQEQDVVIASLLRRLWRMPAVGHRFRPLSVMMKFWSDETIANTERWPDGELVRDGLRLFEELSRTASTDVVLATDLHAGNVLRATREPWLVIDPKPFVGDPAYDATQHLFNCPERMRSKPRETIHRLADLVGVDEERLRLWMFARVAAQPRERWKAEDVVLAKTLT